MIAAALPHGDRQRCCFVLGLITDKDAYQGWIKEAGGIDSVIAALSELSRSCASDRREIRKLLWSIEIFRPHFRTKSKLPSRGKCFDGPLCRFCHIPGDNHPGAVKKISKKSPTFFEFSGLFHTANHAHASIVSRLGRWSSGVYSETESDADFQFTISGNSRLELH